MKQRFLLWMIMLLCAMGIWAKDVKIQVTDERGIAVGNLPVTFMYENLVTDDDGYFTAKGLGSAGTYQFTYQRDSEEQVVRFNWEGAASVKVMIDGNWVVFALKDLTEDEEQEFSSIRLSEHNDYNDKVYYPNWNDSGKWGLFWDAATIFYRTDDSKIFGGSTASASEIKIADLTGDIVIDPKANKQKVTFIFKDKDGNPLDGNYVFTTNGNGYGTYGGSGLYFYRKSGDRCTMSFRSTNYVQMSKTFDVGEQNETFTFDYTGAKSITLKLLDTAGNPMDNQSISIDGSFTQTNATGECVMFALPGEYSYSANPSGYPSQNGSITLMDKDITKVLSYVGYRKLIFKMSDYKADAELYVSLESADGERIFARKNEQTGLYEVIAKDGAYTYDIIGDKTVTIEKEVVVSKDELFDISFKNFRHVTFLAPEGAYSISNVTVFASIDEDRFVYDRIDTDFYMPDGTYTWKASVTDTNSGTTYPANKEQEFTVNGQDMNVTYLFSPSDYLSLTLIVKDRMGQPIEYASVYINNTMHDTDVEGKVVVPVEAGDIGYRVEYNRYTEPGTPYYFGVSGSVTVADENVTKVVSYEDASLLTFELTGNSLPSTGYYPAVYMDRNGGSSTYVNMQSINESSLMYRGQVYVMNKTSIRYHYRTEPYWSGMDDQKITVTGDRTFKLEINDYQKVTITLNGEPFDNKGGFYIKDKTGKGDGSMNNCIYFPKGDYSVSAYTHLADGYTIELKPQNFTVSNAPVTINFEFNPTDYHKVNISLLNSSPDRYYNMELFSDTYSQYHYIDKEFGFVYLPSGEYTYHFTTASNNYVPHFSLPLKGSISITDKDESLEIDASAIRTVDVVVKNAEGKILKTALFQIMKDGNPEIEHQDNDDKFNLFIPEGKYHLSIFHSGYKSISTEINIDASTSRLEYTLQNANSTPVWFGVYDSDEDITGAKITLKNYGSQLTNTDGWAIFPDVVPTDNLTYTVEAPGYETVTGSLSFASVDVVKEVEVDLTGKTVGIKNTNANNGEAISIYPTTPEDYLYLRPESESTGTWMVQLISATATVVYSNKMQLDGETPIYVGNLPKGFYLLTLNNGEQRMTFKVLKK